MMILIDYWCPSPPQDTPVIYQHPLKPYVYLNWPGSMTLWIGGGRGASCRATCSRSNTSSLWLEGAIKGAWNTNGKKAATTNNLIWCHCTLSKSSSVAAVIVVKWIQVYLCESMCWELWSRFFLRNRGGRLCRRCFRKCWDPVQVAVTNATTQTKSKHFGMP